MFPLVCGQPFGTTPEGPDGLSDDRGPFHVIYNEPADDGVCDLCTVDQINGRIELHILELMSSSEHQGRCLPAEVDHIEPACVTTAEQASSDTCSFNAWYWGSCNIKG